MRNVFMLSFSKPVSQEPATIMNTDPLERGLSPIERTLGEQLAWSPFLKGAIGREWWRAPQESPTMCLSRGEKPSGLLSDIFDPTESSREVFQNNVDNGFFFIGREQHEVF